MPRHGVRWADLIETSLSELGGEAHLRDLYEHLFSTREAKRKIAEAKSSTGKEVDMKSQVRCVVQRDPRFTKGRGRGHWKLSANESDGDKSRKQKYSLPARYAERSRKIIKLMSDRPHKTQTQGWAQREIARAMEIDINAVNKLVNFMIMEDLLYLKGGKGKTFDPFVYAPSEDVFEDARRGEIRV